VEGERRPVERGGDLAGQQRGVLRPLAGVDGAADDHRGTGRVVQVVPDRARQGLAAERASAVARAAATATVRAAATMTRRWAFIRGSVTVPGVNAPRACGSRAGAPRVKPIRFPSLRSGPADKKGAYVTWYPSVIHRESRYVRRRRHRGRGPRRIHAAAPAGPARAHAPG